MAFSTKTRNLFWLLCDCWLFFWPAHWKRYKLWERVNCLKTHLKFFELLSFRLLYYYPHFDCIAQIQVIVDIIHSVANGSICERWSESIVRTTKEKFFCKFHAYHLLVLVVLEICRQFQFSFHFETVGERPPRHRWPMPWKLDIRCNQKKKNYMQISGNSSPN